MMQGRPLRFLGGVCACWIGVRVVLLWPDARAVVDDLRQIPLVGTAAAAEIDANIALFPPAFTPMRRAAVPVRPRPGRSAAILGDTDAQILAAAGIYYFAEVAPPAPGAGLTAAPPTTDLPLWTPPPAASGGKRWSLDAWSLFRGGPGQNALGPQLGGGQAGVRLAYFLDQRRRASAYARATTALDDGGVEAAAGVQYQPTKVPVAAFAEVRRRADASVVPVAGVVGGVYQRPIAAGWRVDGYGQAGVVGGGRTEGFADGQARVTHPVTRAGPASLEAGLGAWGGIQRAAARFDLGPTLGLAVPVRSGNLRLTLDWRQRLAGHAAPASGPALTLAAGF